MLTGQVGGLGSASAAICTFKDCDSIGSDGVYVLQLDAHAESLVCIWLDDRPSDCIPLSTRGADLEMDWAMTDDRERKISADMEDIALDGELGHMNVWFFGAGGGISRLTPSAAPAPQVGPLFPSGLPGLYASTTTPLGKAQWLNGRPGEVQIQLPSGLEESCQVELGWQRHGGVFAELVAGATTTVALRCEL